MLLKWKIFTCLAVIWFQHGNCHSPFLIPPCSFCVPAYQRNQNILLYLWSHFAYKESFTFFNRNEWSTILKSIFCVIMHDAIDLSTYLCYFVCFLVLIHKCLTFWTRPLSINISLFTLFFFNTNIIGLQCLLKRNVCVYKLLKQTPNSIFKLKSG